jgi:hypothetical protein
LYESGSRPEEFVRLSNLDYKIDINGAILILRGKTGERRIRRTRERTANTAKRVQTEYCWLYCR